MACECTIVVEYDETIVTIEPEGPQGIPGPEGAAGTAPEFEFSADGLSWHSTPVAEDYYLRISTDRGDTWGEAIYYRGPAGEPGEQGIPGEQGPQGPEVLFQYSADGVNWHSTYMAGDDYFSVSTNEGVTWGEAVYFRGEQGIQGEIGPAGPTGPEVMVQYSADGVDWHSTYMAGDDYFSVSTDEGVTWGEAV